MREDASFLDCLRQTRRLGPYRVLALAVVLSAAIVFWFVFSDETAGSRPDSAGGSAGPGPGPADTVFTNRAAQSDGPSAVHSQPPDAPLPGRAIILSEPPLHLMDDYASPATDGVQDLKIVQDTLQHYLSAVPLLQRYPCGTNREFTRALTGDNRIGIAFIDPNNPAIINGELTDRWGTPLLFHPVSATEVEIRSAGPDGKMWTDDDLTTPPVDGSRYGLTPP